MFDVGHTELAESLHRRADAVADAWQRAIGRTSFVGLERQEIRQRLRELTHQAIDVLVAEEFDASAAHGVGAGVAALGYVLPEALGGTLEVLSGVLLAELAADRAASLQPRLAAFIGSVAIGFSARARTAILDEQEAIRTALLVMRENAEAALRESEARFRAVFEGAAIGITVTDMEGRIVQSNLALQQMLGCREEDMRGKQFLEFTHPDDIAIGWRAFQELLMTGTDRVELELRFMHTNGSIVWGHVAVSLVRDADGRPQFAIGMGEDITRRKQAEEERIQLSREQAARSAAEAAQVRFAFLAEVSNRLASSLDFETTLDQVARSTVPALCDWCTLNLVDGKGLLRAETTAHVNPEHERLAASMRRRYPRSLDDPESPAMAVCRSGHSLLLKDVDESLLRRISRDAEHLAMWHRLEPRAVMIVPLIAHGRTLGTMSLIATAQSGRTFSQADLALAEDLGQRAALAVENAQLYTQAQEAIRTAETAVKVRDEFLSVAAHELKTPVTSLRGFAQLTSRTIDQTGTVDMSRLHKALKVVDQQSEKLTRLVAQLLDVSRLQSGRLVLDCRETDVNQFLLDLVQGMESHSDRHELIAQVPSEPVLLNIDALRFEQVLTNLLDNAMKYSPDGGPVEVSLTANESGASIAVRDHGIGVPYEHRERIFERFYQADATGHHAGGMGLGLYVSRQIVDLHGGQIAAEYPDDGGTRVVVTLPRRGPLFV